MMGIAQLVTYSDENLMNVIGCGQFIVKNFNNKLKINQDKLKIGLSLTNKLHYGNPKYGCLSNEFPIAMGNYQICSSSCNKLSCPTDIPVDTTVVPICEYITKNNGICVLMCKISDKSMGNCPKGATCVTKGLDDGFGIC